MTRAARGAGAMLVLACAPAATAMAGEEVVVTDRRASGGGNRLALDLRAIDSDLAKGSGTDVGRIDLAVDIEYAGVRVAPRSARRPVRRHEGVARQHARVIDLRSS
jgi:hypothetical protein